MKRSVMLIVVLLFIGSCRNEGVHPLDPSPAAATVSDYFPMTVGSYWVYQIYTLDSSFNARLEEWWSDSVVVEKDTICRGYVYAKIVSSWKGITYVRDSSGYLVALDGTKLFTVNSEYSYLDYRYQAGTDSSFIVTTMMARADSVWVVPAGTFLARSVVGSLIDLHPSSQRPAVRRFHRAFAKSVGEVNRRMIFVFSNSYLEERLTRYNIVQTSAKSQGR